jgi:hypothetical protein
MCASTFVRLRPDTLAFELEGDFLLATPHRVDCYCSIQMRDFSSKLKEAKQQSPMQLDLR